MLKRCLFVFYFVMWFPVPAVATSYASDTRSAPMQIGTYIRGQVLACFEKKHLERVLDTKHSISAALLLFQTPYPCSITTVTVYLDELHKKFRDADGNYFWIIGVSADPKPGTQFYIVLPADNLKRAP